MLEGDNDEVNDVNDEEELTDDELNEIIARDENELVLFKEIDDQRKAADRSEWNGRGRQPERLMQEWELPEVYLKDEDYLLRQNQETAEYGRGQRTRGQVHYDDGLTEEQWVNVSSKNYLVFDHCLCIYPLPYIMSRLWKTKKSMCLR